MAFMDKRRKSHAGDDLGFGTRAQSGDRDRLLNRDGSFAVKRHGMPLRSIISLFHSLLVMRWHVFLALVAALYMGLNAAFALGYWLMGPEALVGGRGHSFARAFFFSVHTSSTIGYGHVTPASLGANLLVTLEALASLIGFALVSGVVFARFSRPVADIVFSEKAIVAPYRGGRAFEFRIANRRRNQIIEVNARVFLAMVDLEGNARRRSFHELSLERDQIAFFPLSWTVVHPIDEDSPLNGLSPQDLKRRDAEFLVALTGIDETLEQSVHARSSYKAEEVEWDVTFQNMYEFDDGMQPIAIDLSRIHDVE